MNFNNLFPYASSREYLISVMKEYISPPENLSLSEWSDEYRVLAQGTTSEPGRWKTRRVPYLKDVMNCVTSEETNYIVMMTCNQVGKGEVINNAIGYFMHQNPSPMLMVQPDVGAAKKYSKTKLTPMFMATKVLKQKMDGFQQNILEKNFPGGFLLMVGANSPAGLASNTVKFVAFDEVDRYEDGAGKEGDQIELGIKRTDNYAQSRKIIITSTPGEKYRSKVYNWYQRSTQEVWHVKCPECDKYTNFTIKDFDYKNLQLACKKCGILSSEASWKKQQKTGKYIPQNSNGDKKVRGFHINAFSSPWVPWLDIATDYERALKDPLKMIAFMNTRMGLPWEGKLNYDDNYKDVYDKHREEYGAELHKDILLLTCGIDVQKGWFALEVMGWGRDETCYGVLYKEIKGDPKEPKAWEKIEEIIEKSFYFKDGKSLKIEMTFIDTGGHYTFETYNFLYGKEERGIYGIKGDSYKRKEYIVRSSVQNKTAEKPVTVIFLGVDPLKEYTYEKLEKEKGEPGSCYFPSARDKGYNKSYFKGLFSEKKEETFNKRGFKQINWVKVRERNEPLDVRNYGTAAMKQLNPDWDELEKALNKKVKKKVRIFKRS